MVPTRELRLGDSKVLSRTHVYVSGGGVYAGIILTADYDENMTRGYKGICARQKISNPRKVIRPTDEVPTGMRVCMERWKGEMIRVIYRRKVNFAGGGRAVLETHCFF